MTVRRATRVAVGEALEAVARDLRIPSVRIRWFKGARPCWDNADAALYALSTRIRPDLKAAAVASVEPPVIWLRATLKPALAALLAAHEARHVWQERALEVEDRRRWHVATSERDADQYAWEGALPAALKAKAYAAVAGKPLGRRFGL
ncbi:MAG: hypothetical protein C5B48_08705 [Candidatus Rokuibacteriota bacterium]|nr:MAG: hypothetical protein C5B48_08705 [Candidatus Rokubacteria bacterium]